jgi:hypothetical protein
VYSEEDPKRRISERIRQRGPKFEEIQYLLNGVDSSQKGVRKMAFKTMGRTYYSRTHV